MKSLEELAALRERMKNSVAMRQDNSNTTRVVVGMATCGIAAGARPVLTAFVEEVNRRSLQGRKLISALLRRQVTQLPL